MTSTRRRRAGMPSGIPSVVAGLVLFAPAVLAAQPSCPAEAGPHAESGWSAYRAGDMQDARAAFRRALELCPGLEYARTGLGYVALRGGEDAAAAELFGAVVQAQPDDVDALVGLGLLAWRSGDTAEARRRFARVRALEPDHPTAVDYLARLDRAEADASATDPADRAWAGGDLDAALPLYEARLAADPADRTALLRLGQARSWRDDREGALELFDRLIALDPDHFDARVARARVYAWTGDVSRAIVEVEAVLVEAPGHTEALTAVDSFRSWSDGADETLEVRDPFSAITAGDADFRSAAARAPARGGMAEGTVDRYRERLREDPDDTEARLGLARALALAGDYDGSVAEYDRVAAAVPGDVRALVGRATTTRWNGRLKESEAAALDATVIDPNSGAAWSALGWTYRAQGRTADALEAFSTALRMEPSDAEVRTQLRSIRRSLRPAVRPTFTAEDDSDGNRMLTTVLAGAWHPAPRWELGVEGRHRRLEQAGAVTLERTVIGATATGRYEAGPGWLLLGSAGGFSSDRGGDDTFLSGSLALRSPDRHSLGFTVALATTGLDETAALVEQGVRATSGTLAGRWVPDGRWRIDGSVTLGSYEGSARNGRRGWSLGGSRRMGPVSLGVAHRGFSFENDVNDGYFDPDFYGIVELTGYWLLRPGPWRLVLDAAPGIEQVGSDGDPAPTLRSRLRVGYVLDAQREVSLSVGYSDAGLSNFATGADGYRYVGVTVGVDWVF